MKFSTNILIANRYARSSKGGKFVSFISLFSMAGVCLGVMALIIAVSVMNGFEALLKQRMLGAVPHVSLGMSQSQDQLQIIKSELTEKKSELGLLQVLPLNQAQAIMQLPSDLRGVLVQGIGAESEIPLGVKSCLVSGDWPTLLEQKYSIYIGRYLAMEYGIGVGDKIRLLLSGASHYTPLGRMPAQRNFTVRGIFETESEIDQQVVFVKSRDLNRLLKQPATASQGLRLVLEDPFAVSTARLKISETLDPGVEIEDWRKTHGKLFEAVRMEKNMMWFMLSLIIAVAAFNIVSALVMMVTKKQNEVAILKTLGMTSSDVKWIFTLQGAYSGIFGAILGAILGTIATLGLNPFIAATGLNLLGLPGMGLPVEFDLSKVFYIVIFAFVLAIVASIYPARQAANLKPSEVLRYE